jgi:hypothetical protein
MRGVIGSLNAAVAGSIMLFEALGQRDPSARPASLPVPAAPDDAAASGPAGPGKVAQTSARSAKSAKPAARKPKATTKAGLKAASRAVAEPAPAPADPAPAPADETPTELLPS